MGTEGQKPKFSIGHLRQVVIYGCDCLWPVFLENVESVSPDARADVRAYLAKEVARCRTQKDLEALANRFV